jgi:hypothetical protein
MTSIANRATPAQALLMRMVEGAVRDAVSCHPEWSFDERLVKSIAKRAAGTISGQWSELLAASTARADRPSDLGGGVTS